jgi:hypothetical protein
MTDLERAIWLLMSTDDYKIIEQTADSATLVYVHNDPPHPHIVIQVKQPGIREHVRLLHPRIRLLGRSDNELSREHAGEHHRLGSSTHHHGPNAGPHARPRGWRDGSGVVLIDRQAAVRARRTGPGETVTFLCVEHHMELHPDSLGTGLRHVRHGDRCYTGRIIVRRETETDR